MNAAHIERRKDHIGRIMYVVAGMVTTYCPIEAVSLVNGDDADALFCSLTATAAATFTPASPYETPHIPVCHGLL